MKKLITQIKTFFFHGFWSVLFLGCFVFLSGCGQTMKEDSASSTQETGVSTEDPS